MNYTPSFRIWDNKHKRWFQGGTSEQRRKFMTDSINFFGEIMIMQGTLFDQNEDKIWANDPDINGSLDIINYLEVVEGINVNDISGYEIFRGDIVEIKAYDYEDFHIKGVVTRDDRHARYIIKPLDDKREYPVITFDNVDYSYEIVGNIFETPIKFPDKTVDTNISF